jgi:hypothetical protein
MRLASVCQPSFRDAGHLGVLVVAASAPPWPQPLAASASSATSSGATADDLIQVRAKAIR